MSALSKTAKLRLVLGEVQQMLDHLVKFKFLSEENGKYHLEHNGENLKQNLHSEWLISNYIECDEPSFLLSSNPKLNVWNSLDTVKPLIKELPCNIIVNNENCSTQNNSSDPTGGNVMNTINSYFNYECGIRLRRYLFCHQHNAQYFFSKLQRERQTWWKKFSASPGRFTFSHIVEKEDTQIVRIQAQFPWGTVPVESIKLLMDVTSNKKKNEEPSPIVISSEIVLEKAVLTFMCDSYEVLDEKGPRILRLHRKLAPYKIAFSGMTNTKTNEITLKELALLLAKRIRKSAISVLLLPDMCSTPLDEQILRNDSYGIPYTVIMDEKTLKNGLLELRNRDTTLKEQSHVASIVPYIEKLMKTY